MGNNEGWIQVISLSGLLFRRESGKEEEEKKARPKAVFLNDLKDITKDINNAANWFFGTGKYEKIENNGNCRQDFSLPDAIDIFSQPSFKDGGECEFTCPYAETEKLVMTQDAYKKMLSYAYYANKKGGKEVGMIMVSNADGVVHEIHMPKQVASGGDFSFESIDAMEIKKCINNGERFVGWSHSHCNMSPFLSGTDIENIETLLEVHPKIFSVVTNAKGDTRAWMHCKLPCGEASVREISISLVMDENVLKEEIKLEVEEKLRGRVLFPLPGRIIEFVSKNKEAV